MSQFSHYLALPPTLQSHLLKLLIRNLMVSQYCVAYNIVLLCGFLNTAPPLPLLFLLPSVGALTLTSFHTQAQAWVLSWPPTEGFSLFPISADSPCLFSSQPSHIILNSSPQLDSNLWMGRDHASINLYTSRPFLLWSLKRKSLSKLRNPSLGLC